ncbi:MAG: PTS sugar transporter subunit IIA [Alphaproteobacteria bacterium]|nr:PTS sugar transporter subunit IIA [Alphaproteobacteria bacterium]MBO4643129.1 PTS sugar transporter subunit IIA [Alphaproteobacteria bacterium]
MIGLLLVSHRRLAEEMKAVMEHVVGPQEQVDTISIFPSDDMEECRKEIQDKITALNTGDGVIVLTDMFGGTPSNLAISMMTHDDIEVLAGMNLPMLIKLAQVRTTMPLKEATLSAQEAGKKYINAASVLLNHNS